MLGFIYKTAEHCITDLLYQADINVNGSRPWDIRIKNKSFFERVATDGSLALGESYMDGWWECDALDQFFCNLLSHGIDQKVRLNNSTILAYLKSILINCQNRHKAFEVGEKHYDTGNDLFELMLDDHMAYSCGYWKDANTLNQAQEAKMDIICRKLLLRPGMQLLDIGCGWGSLVEYAARYYGVDAVGITISKEQAKLAKERCRDLPVDIRLQDYREVQETFDAVVSVGMFEHVGYKNYRKFMSLVRQCLRDKGLFLLHTIGSNSSNRYIDPWFDKYIFPNSMLPSIKQIGSAIECKFVMEDWHNFGVFYDRTLMAWYENFNRHWPSLQKKYDERFYRMWSYYLLSSAGGFRSRYMQVWQIVLSTNGLTGGYTSLRCPECLS